MLIENAIDINKALETKMTKKQLTEVPVEVEAVDRSRLALLAGLTTAAATGGCTMPLTGSPPNTRNVESRGGDHDRGLATPKPQEHQEHPDNPPPHDM